jgi:hypothetical protein
MEVWRVAQPLNFRSARHSGGTVMSITRAIGRRSTIQLMEEAAIPTELIG